MAERGRQAGFVMGAEHRTKIANSKILNRLIAHAEGEVDMTSTQISAAVALLDRVMPKLQSMTVEGGEEPIRTLSEVVHKIVRARAGD
jgi:hypothetical protein